MNARYTHQYSIRDFYGKEWLHEENLANRTDEWPFAKRTLMTSDGARASTTKLRRDKSRIDVGIEYIQLSILIFKSPLLANRFIASMQSQESTV